MIFLLSDLKYKESFIDVVEIDGDKFFFLLLMLLLLLMLFEMSFVLFEFNIDDVDMIGFVFLFEGFFWIFVLFPVFDLFLLVLSVCC